MKKKAKPAKKPKAKTKTKPKAKAKAKAKKVVVGIPSNPELEAVIASEPRDDHAWSVFEDWMLETNDPRAAIVMAERSEPTRPKDYDWSRDKQVTSAYDALRKSLYGNHAQWVLMKNRTASYSTWRAGHITRLSLWIDKRYDDALECDVYEALLATPAARLVAAANLHRRRLVLPWIERLARSPAVRSLRAMSVSLIDDWYSDKPKPFDPQVLAPFAIDDFAISGGIVSASPQLARLKSFALDHRDHAWTVQLFSEMTFPELRTLELETQEMTGDVLAPLLPGTVTPKLETLVLHDDFTNVTKVLVEALRSSPLLRQLRTLKLGRDPETGSQQPARVEPGAFLGKEFSHLELLTVP